MTRAARKKSSGHQTSATIGKVSRGAGGIVIVEYATNIVDNGAPDYFITHLCRVEKLGPGTVRISWGCQQDDGTIEIKYRAIMDIHRWQAQQGAITDARSVIARLPTDGEKRREAH